MEFKRFYDCKDDILGAPMEINDGNEPKIVVELECSVHRARLVGPSILSKTNDKIRQMVWNAHSQGKLGIPNGSKFSVEF